MNYQLCIKDQGEGPPKDYVRELKARSKGEAAEKFWMELPNNEYGKGNWDVVNLLEFIEEI